MTVDTILSRPYRFCGDEDLPSRLTHSLSGDLDFHEKTSAYASHNLHSFPAKFPPQLPRKLILELTEPGDTVLDPMVGSGTTVVESLLLGRNGIGFDIDPLALLLSKVKVSSFDKPTLEATADEIAMSARLSISDQYDRLEQKLKERFDPKTREFIDYWFARETQVELLSLILAIEELPPDDIRNFFLLVFSSIIITKSGGVSMAFDLAHTRPHRAKIVYSQYGDVLIGEEHVGSTNKRINLLTKTLRSPIDDFEKRSSHNIQCVFTSESDRPARVQFGDVEQLPLPAESVDLIVTSPPYASNAIDYMRAHKFSLVWMGYKIDDLSRKRAKYIGGESVSDFSFVGLPQYTQAIVDRISARDAKKGQVVHRYYSEMTRTISEMYRVIKFKRPVILVVGTSVIKGIDTETGNCLAEIGCNIGFDKPVIGVRNLDRNRRMLPAGMKVDRDSQIQQRMHRELVIGFYKS